MRKSLLAALLAALSLGAGAADPPPAPGINRNAAAPAPGAPAVEGVGSSQAMAQADNLLMQAEKEVLLMEGVSKGGENCPPGFTFSQMIADIRSGKLQGGEIENLSQGAGRAESRLYFVCQAVAGRSPKACDDAGLFQPKDGKGASSQPRQGAPGAPGVNYSSYQGSCVAFFHSVRTRAAYLSRDPQFLSYCREAAPYAAPFRDGAAVEMACKAYQGNAGDPRALAAMLPGALSRPVPPEFALQASREMLVDPTVCASVQDDMDRALCGELADYRKALAGRSIKACRGGLCQMLMGAGAGACESYAAGLKKVACTRRYGGDYAGDRQRLLEQQLGLVEKLLAGGELTAVDLRTAKAFTARLDKLYELRDRSTRALDAVAPKRLPSKSKGS